MNKVKEILDDYNQRRAELETRKRSELRAICVPYAQEKARYKPGDIIRRHNLTIRIESVGARIRTNDIVPVYRGPELTKSLAVRKDNPIHGYEIDESDDIVLVKKS